MNLFGSNDGEEHVERNLDGVEEEQSVLVGDELKVDEMDKRPDLPGSLASSEEIGLDLGTNGSEGVTVAESEVSKKDRHENRAPHSLVDDDLFGDGKSILSGDLAIEPVVEVVARRSVVEKSKGGKSDESLDVEWTSGNEDLLYSK